MIVKLIEQNEKLKEQIAILLTVKEMICNINLNFELEKE